MLFLSSSKRQLKYAAYKISARAAELGLQVKPNWQIHRISRLHPVDMMGYRFSPYCTTLRKRVFRLARRALLRVRRAFRRGWPIGRRRAARLSSYHGYTSSTDCKLFLHRVGASRLFSLAFNLIKSCSKHYTLKSPHP